MRLALVALVLYATPALAQMVICTKPDASKYVGAQPPEGCVTEKTIGSGGQAVTHLKPGKATVTAIQSVDGERRPATVFESQQAVDDCMESLMARIPDVAVARARGRYVRPEDEPEAAAACTEAELGSLTSGTTVEVLAPSSRCGRLEAVKVLDGKNAGLEGCIASTFLRPEPEEVTP